MINLTEFIGQKLNNRQQFSRLKGQKQDKQTSQNWKHFHDESFSSKSLGLSTILDLQNQQDNFGGLGISRIGNYSRSRYKQSNGEKHINTVKNTKDELQQMKQKRKYLEQKINHTLCKQEISKNTKEKSKNFDIHRHKSDQFILSEQENQQYSKEISQNGKIQSQNSLQNSKQEFEQVNKKQVEQHFSNSSYSSYQFSSVNKSHLDKESDRFLSFLKKDIYTLKCEKFIHLIRKFKNKWLTKNINQWIELSKIIKREQNKLSRFVFISWKRHVNEQNRKLIMAEMIRKRIEQKRNQIKEVQTKNQQKQDQKLRKDSPVTNKSRTNWRDLNNSRANLREISPIRPNKDSQLQFPNHELSYYDQYSCITEISQINHQEEEQFIK